MSPPPPFLLIPARRNSPSTTVLPPPLPASSSSSRSSPPPAAAAASHPAQPAQRQSAPAPFHPPAHAHAHHLHSIPPRDKSTRSLILDELCALHISTRLGSARAELGYGNIQSADEAEEGRHRHEFWTGFGVESDGSSDRGGSEDGDERDGEGDVRMRVPNTTLSANLHAKAAGYSNVLCATLLQPPHPDSTHPHKVLPNSVRFRLALAILTDQYFAPPLSSSSSRRGSNDEEGQQEEGEIPIELAPFVQLSSYRPAPSSLPMPIPPPPIPIHTNTTSLPGIKSILSPTSTSPTSPSFASFSAPGLSRTTTLSPSPFFSSSTPTTSSNPTPPPSVSPLFHPSTAYSTTLSSSSSSSIFHHHRPTIPLPKSKNPIIMGGPGTGGGTKGQIPVPSSMIEPNWAGRDASSSVGYGKGSVRPPSSSSSSPSSSHHAKLASSIFSTGLSPTQTQNICTRHLKSCSAPACMPIPRNVRSTIGAGLDSTFPLRSLAGCTLSHPSPSSNNATHKTHTLTVLSNFLKLSSLLLSELSDESEYESADGEGEGEEWTPKREWYALLSALLTRVVLEGYLRSGWRSTRPAEVLFGFGGGRLRLGSSVRGDQTEVEAVDDDGGDEDGNEDEGEDGEGEQREKFEPDGWGSLVESYVSLFGEHHDAPGGGEGKDKIEFRKEMRRRRDEFLDPEPNTPLIQHLQTLNARYPPSILTTHLIKFIESVSAFRGPSELSSSSPQPHTLGYQRGGEGMGRTGSLIVSPPSSPQQRRQQMQQNLRTNGAKKGVKALRRFFAPKVREVGVGEKRGRSESLRSIGGRG